MRLRQEDHELKASRPAWVNETVSWGEGVENSQKHES